MVDSEPTKRNVVSMTSRFFDPVTILFKMFFQQLCEAKLGWDDSLMGGLLKEWTRLYMDRVIPRCYCKSPRVCYAPAKAYAAVSLLLYPS